MLLIGREQLKFGSRTNMKSDAPWQSIPDGWIQVHPDIEQEVWDLIVEGYQFDIHIEVIEIDDPDYNTSLDDEIPKIVREVVTSVTKGDPIILPEAEPQLDEAILESRQMLKSALQIPMVWNEKHFTVTLEKQNLLSSQLALAKIAQEMNVPFQPEWNETGEECTPWEIADLISLSFAIAAYIKPMLSMQRTTEVLLKNSEPKQSNYEEILNEYQKFLQDTMVIGGSTK